MSTYAALLMLVPLGWLFQVAEPTSSPPAPEPAAQPPEVPVSSGLLLIDDFAQPDGLSALGTPWRAITDGVMGGVSQVTTTVEEVDGRRCIRMRGDVRLENNGGFIQVGLDLTDSGGLFDASGFEGIYLWARGNGEDYSVHLRTPAARLPWQSYRASFHANDEWHEVRIPFTDFEGNRISAPLDTSALRRLGLFAIGRAFTADLAVAEIGFYAEEQSPD